MNGEIWRRQTDRGTGYSIQIQIFRNSGYIKKNSEFDYSLL